MAALIPSSVRGAGVAARSSRTTTMVAVPPASLCPRTSLVVPHQVFSPAARPCVTAFASNLKPLRALADIVSNGNVPTYTPKTVPDESILATWRGVDAVCFDVDCTCTINDSLDALAAYMGVAEEVEALTHKAMDGTMDLAQSLEARLNILNCTPSDIRGFIKANPPESRLAPNIKKFITALQARGIAVYLISGGFRELILPLAKYLNVPAENVFANRMNWQWDDESGMPTKLVGFDLSEPTAHNLGKPQAIARIRQNNPYKTIAMIGDGITDLEAVQVSGGADLFIGYGGIIERANVAEAAEWYIYDFQTLLDTMKRYKVAVVGSGAWACAAMHMIAQNTKDEDPADDFVDEVKMWVHECEWEGRPLTEVINETHENPKYLPGVKLGDNVIATPNLADAVKDADVIVFCAPHQFIHNICKALVGKVKKDAIAISLIKGMRVRPQGAQLISEMVRKILGIDCSVLMGANIASDIGNEELSEAVIGYNYQQNGEIFRKLFETPYFAINLLPDVTGAEMCGTLKNIVAVGAGIVDGLGMGPNSKATVMRQGLYEMKKFSKALYPTVRDDTFLEGCGIGDLIATCYGGRNRFVACEWTKLVKAGTPKTFDELEVELLKGQKLQGVLTSDEVQEIIQRKGWELEYPLFTSINRIIHGHLAPEYVVKYKQGAAMPVAKFLSSTDDNDGDVAPVKTKKSLNSKASAPAPVAAEAPREVVKASA